MATNDKRTVLVTGAGSGIGRASALAFAEAGYRVAAADIDERAGTATAEAAGGGAIAVQADVGDVADIDRMVSTVVAELGHLDVILNNAGVTRGAYIMNLTEEDWDRMHRVNAKGVFFCLQRAAREMIPRREGRIINIASIAGRGFAGTSNAAYAASKGAVISLTKTAAQQLARHNINVNSICPGVTMTEMVSALVSQRAEKEGISLGTRRWRRRCGRFPSGGRTIRRTSRRWRSSSPRPAPATSPGSATTWTAASSRAEPTPGSSRRAKDGVSEWATRNGVGSPVGPDERRWRARRCPPAGIRARAGDRLRTRGRAGELVRR